MRAILDFLWQWTATICAIILAIWSFAVGAWLFGVAMVLMAMDDYRIWVLERKIEMDAEYIEALVARIGELVPDLEGASS